MSVNEQLTDLYELKENLYSVHPCLYRFTTKIKLDSLFNEIEYGLNQPCSNVEFSNKIAPIFSQIKDAHTWQRPPQSKTSNLKIPIDIKIISGEIYIKNNISTNSKIKRGQKVLSINNEPSDSILIRLMSQLSTDGGIQSTKTRVIEEWFRHIYTADNSKSVKIKLTNEKKTFETKIDLIESTKIDSIRLIKHLNTEDKLSKPYYDFKINNGIGFLKIVHFAPISWADYTTFLDESINELNRNKISDLVIDLRWNIGGPRDYPIFLYSKITDKPFDYLDYLITRKSTIDANIPFDSTKTFEFVNNDTYKVTKGARGIGLQEPHSSNYTGNIYLLVDGQSNSSSSQIASLIKSNKRGIIIGEETGGIYSGGTGEYHLNFTLKNSKVSIQIPRYQIVLSVDESLNDLNKGTKPDYPIVESIESFDNNVDLFILKAIELINQ